MKSDMQAEGKSRRIAVLLSTYNGAGYLVRLLESILDQNWPHWDLWVRDDGSDDDTLKILDEFAGRLKQKNQSGRENRMHVIRGENIGVVRSFFQLLEKAENGNAIYSGYAFCDQDDVWLPEKLERAARTMKPDVPFLYHARQWLTDQKSGEKTLSPVPDRTGFANALIQNQVVGCTMVINPLLRQCVMDTLRAANREISRSGSDPSSNHALIGTGDNVTSSHDKVTSTGDKSPSTGDADPCSGIIMHDWWCYLLASAFGQIHYDPEPVIEFRRHEESTTPVSTGFFRMIRKRLSALRKRGWSVGHILEQARVLQRHITQSGNDTAALSPYRLSDSDRQLLISLLEIPSTNLFRRFGYLFTGVHKRADTMDTLVFRLLVLFRRF